MRLGPLAQLWGEADTELLLCHDSTLPLSPRFVYTISVFLLERGLLDPGARVRARIVNSTYTGGLALADLG
jgi:hypothetical protein